MAERRDIEIRTPFAIGPSGGVAFTADPVQQAAQHLIAIIGTQPPERPMRPTYGTPTQNALFDADDPTDQAVLVVEIRDAVRTWAPEIQIVDIEAQSSQSNDGRIEYAVKFKMNEDGAVEEVLIEAGEEVTSA